MSVSTDVVETAFGNNLLMKAYRKWEGGEDNANQITGTTFSVCGSRSRLAELTGNFRSATFCRHVLRIAALGEDRKPEAKVCF